MNNVVILLCLLILSCKSEYDGKKREEKRTDVTFVTVNFEGFEDYIEQHKAGTLVVNFWATWCKPCIKELPAFEQLGSDYKDQDVAVVLVSLDFPDQVEKLKDFILKKNLKSEVLLLNEANANNWIPKVDPSWSGAVPATLIISNSTRTFYERSFTYKELVQKLLKQLKI